MRVCFHVLSELLQWRQVTVNLSRLPTVLTHSFSVSLPFSLPLSLPLCLSDLNPVYNHSPASCAGLSPHTEAVTDKAMPNKTQPSALTESLNSPITQPAGMTSTLLSLISLSFLLSVLCLKFIIYRVLANQIFLLIKALLFDMAKFYFRANRNMVYDYEALFNQHSGCLKLLTSEGKKHQMSSKYLHLCILWLLSQQESYTPVIACFI